MAYSWAKVYIEVIDDHKMGTLPDSLWRRVIELILLAKKNDKDGFLPGMIEMSWVLRMSAEQLEGDLEKLSQVGIVELKEGNWYLTNFVKRQSAEPVVERVSNFRKRNVQQTSNDSVTQSYQTKTRLDIDTDEDKEIGAHAPTPRKRKPRIDDLQKDRIPEAVNEYRSVARTFPDKATWGSIADSVGNDAARLKFWREVVSAYIGLGWNKRNVVSMLEWFGRNELPHLERSNGNGRKPNAITRRDSSDDEATLECAARINARNGK